MLVHRLRQSFRDDSWAVSNIAQKSFARCARIQNVGEDSGGEFLQRP